MRDQVSFLCYSLHSWYIEPVSQFILSDKKKLYKISDINRKMSLLGLCLVNVLHVELCHRNDLLVSPMQHGLMF